MTSGSISASIIIPGLAAIVSAANDSDCHGKKCHPVNEYCDSFSQECKNCGDAGDICDTNSHNYDSDSCVRKCPAYLMQTEIKEIYNQQTIILILLILLLVLIILRYSWKCCHWLSRKRFIIDILKKLRLKNKQKANIKDANGLGATTIQNVMTINEVERAPSQIYSVTGAEGSVITMTTPVSTRYPAEDSTPTNIPTEYSYDNQALAITPVSEKPNSAQAF